MIRNEVTEAIARRRSIRKYTTKPVTDEELETILECGTLAPSGMNLQQWFVSAVRDPALLREISALQKEAVLAMPDLPPSCWSGRRTRPSTPPSARRWC